MQTLITIPAFLFVLGVIIFVHELGHYLVAKAFGVRVITFSLGFGKRAWGFERNGTDYRISVLPLGGYVRMAGEMPEEKSHDPGNFQNKRRWQRILVYLAGPAMNVVLSVTLIAAVFMYGIAAQGLQDAEPVVGQVLEESAGERAGLLPGDRILAVDGGDVRTWGDFDLEVSTAAERELLLEVMRGDQLLTIPLTPEAVPKRGHGEAGLVPRLQLMVGKVLPGKPAEQAGMSSGDVILRIEGHTVETHEVFVEQVSSRAGLETSVEVLREGEILDLTMVPRVDEDGKVRVGIEIGYFRPLPFFEAVGASIRYNIDIVKKTGQVLGKLFTYEIAPKSALSGPIDIAVASG
ncbi:MAG: RIP metalloprotease RseP, partial [Holophagales bacterium]|nr:RIP metalloprotease RseP [Holophagales bacterium]